MNRIAGLLMILFFGWLTYSAFHMPLQTSHAITHQQEYQSYSIDITDTSNLGKNNLINLVDLKTNISFDLKYASLDNFTGQRIYPSISFPVLREETAEKLKNANEEFYQLGYRIKIFDAYRPHRYQFKLREVAEAQNPTTASYIANPETGSNHNRGASVDITLTDLQGRELNMPTKFDHFGPESSIHYTGCTKEQMENRELLGTIMEKHGFNRISSEWWHFDDTDCKDYEILDVDFIDLYN